MVLSLDQLAFIVKHYHETHSLKCVEDKDILSHNDSQIANHIAAILNYDTRIGEHSHGNLCSVIHF